jgi:hypothetical protein
VRVFVSHTAADERWADGGVPGPLQLPRDPTRSAATAACVRRDRRLRPARRRTSACRVWGATEPVVVTTDDFTIDADACP